MRDQDSKAFKKRQFSEMLLARNALNTRLYSYVLPKPHLALLIGSEKNPVLSGTVLSETHFPTETNVNKCN